MTEPALHKLKIESTGYYFAEPPRSSPAPLLLGLHGYGQTAAEFFPIMQRMGGEVAAAASAQGFNQLWDPHTKKITFSWLTSFEKQDSLDRNNAFLLKIIDGLIAEGVADRDKVFLLGFSQGSSVAYRFAQANPGRVRGIVSVCADLPPDLEGNLDPLQSTAVFIAYGLRDPIFPQSKPLHAAEALRAKNVDTEIISFDRGHLIPSSLGPKVQDWMKRKLTERR